MLSTCFPPLPIPTPLQTWRLRAGRLCRGAVWRHRQTVERSCRGHWDSVEELSGGTDAVRGDLTTELHLHWWLTCNNYSNRIQSFARCSQPGQLNSPTPRNAPLSRALVQQYPRRFLKNGIFRRGQADQRCSTHEQLVLPSSLRPDVPREIRGYISIYERCTVVPCFREREGDMMLGMVVR